MFKKFLAGFGAAFLVGVAILLVFDLNPQAWAQGSLQGGKGRWSSAVGQVQPGTGNRATAGLIAAPVTEPLDQAEIKALQQALDDEYHAWSIYEQVITDFGAVRPFTNIQRAEEQHISALTTLFNKYGLTVPENTWMGNVPQFDSTSAACAAAAQAEIDNAALYDNLFAATTNADILAVFTTLQAASLNKHLPAFERCATR